MFRKVYKSANDDIIPDSQLLDNILAQQHKKNSYFHSTYYKYGSVAAAFLILIGTLVIYPKMSDTLNSTQNKTITESFDFVTPAPTLTKEPDAEIIKIPTKQNIKTKTSPSKTSSPTIQTAVLEESNTTLQISEEYPVMTVSEAFDETPAFSPEEESMDNTTFARSRMIADEVESTQAKISENDAIKIADRVFSEDFGDEFISSTKISVVRTEHFEVTRFNETLSYTVTVFDDGEFEKQY